MGKDKTLISILNYNGTEDTIACIKTFYSYEDKEKYTVVIWDNASKESEQQLLEQFVSQLSLNIKVCDCDEYKVINANEYDLILVLSSINLGFSAGNNAVINPQLEKFQYIILLNNDTEFVESTTQRLVKYLDQNADVGVATTAIYYYYDRNAIWNAGGKTFLGTRKYYTEKYVQKLIEKGVKDKEVDYITGCYLAVRSDILSTYGVLTEKFFFGEEDYEFCMRMKRANVPMKVLVQEKLYHKVGTSIKRDQDTLGMNRRTFVHHLNRFVDMKSQYSKVRWTFWRWCSSAYIFLLMLKKTNYDFRWVTHYIKQLNRQAIVREDVSREFFLKVIDGEVV